MPLIVRWPGVTKPGTICEAPVISMDFYPTFLAAAGTKIDAAMPLDGRDLTPLLRGAPSLDRDALYFHYPSYAFHKRNRLGGAIRSGCYKLILNYDDQSTELYDLQADIGEKHDVANVFPERTRAMRQSLLRWLKDTGAKMPRRRTKAD